MKTSKDIILNLDSSDFDLSMGMIRLNKFNLLRVNLSIHLSKSHLLTFSLSCILSLCASFGAFAQTELIPASDGGFENSTTTLAANGWTVVDAQDNVWVAGTYTYASGSKSAYITDNAGSDNIYRIDKSRASHFYRDIYIPTGGTTITLSFNWKAGGEFVGSNAYDHLLVYTAPTTVLPVRNVPASPATAIANATLVFSQTGIQSAYTTQTITLPDALAGTTVRLIFTWQNDNNSFDNQQGASIDNVSLKYTPTPPPTISGFSPSSGCASTTPVVITGSNFTGATAVTFGGTNAASFTVNSATQITATPATGTTGVIRVTTLGGTATTTGSFTVNSLPLANAITGTNTVCISSTLNLNSNATGTAPFTYTWLSSNNGLATVTNAGVVTGVATGAPNITYTVTDGNGCTATSANYAVTVNARPTPGFTSSPGTSTCSSTSITYTTQAAQSNYIWSVSGTLGSDYTISSGGTGSSTNTVTLQWLTSGNKTVTVNYSNGNGCTGAATATNTTTVYLRPTPTFTTVPVGTICSGTNVTYTTQSSQSNYTWIVPGSVGTNYSIVSGGIGTGSNTVTLQWITAGSKTVSVNYTNSGGCTGVSVATVTNNVVTTKPTAGAITGVSSVCARSTITLVSNGSGTVIPLTYTWASSNVGLAIVTNGGVVNGIAAGTPNITYTVTDGNGCTATSAAYGVTVIASPIGTLTAAENSGTSNNDNIICTGATVTYTATSGYQSYVFKVNGVSKQNSTSNVFCTSSLNNSDVVTVDVANSLNCGNTFIATAITVTPLPTATLTADKTTICPGELVTFTAGGGNSYTFKVNGASIQSGASNTFITSSLSNGDIVTVAASNANGCANTSAPIAITVKDQPTGTLTPSSTSICDGTSVTFIATSGYSSYTFKVNGTLVGTPGVSNTYSSSSLTNPSVATVDVINSLGCSSKFVAPAVIVNQPSAGSLTIIENSGTANDNIICDGTSVSFTATTGFINYKFYLNAGALVQQGASNFYTSTTLANGDFVSVTATNTNGCTSVFSTPAITVYPKPAGTLSVSLVSICSGENVNFTATAGYSNYDFRVNGVTEQNGPGNTFNSTSLNNGNIVTVDVTNNNGCITRFNQVTMHVDALPNGTLSIAETSGNTPNDAIICTGATVTFTAPSSFTDYNFLLNGISDQDGSSNLYTTSALQNGDIVTVAVTNSNGCMALLNSYTITVNGLPSVSPITGTLTACANGSTQLADATAGGTWSSGNTAIATVNGTGLVSGITAGSATITYSFTNSNGCLTSVSAVVTVNPLPSIQPITTSAPSFDVCIGNQIALANLTPGGTWSSSNNAIATVNTSGIVTGLASGVVTINYSVTDVNSCNATVTVPVTVHSWPVVQAITTSAASFDVCVSSNITLANTTPAGIWSSSNTSIATINSSGVVTGLADGITIISYTVSVANSCSTAVTQIVSVHALPVPTLSGPNPICPNSVDTYFTEAGQSNYSWTLTGGAQIAGGTPTDNFITIKWVRPGIRTIFVNYQNSFGCSGASSTTVMTNTGTTPTISGPASLCFNSNGIYTTQAGQTNYTWNVIGGIITAGAATNTVTIHWDVAGTGSVSVNFNDINGCISASPTFKSVTVTPLPNVITNNISTCTPNTADLTAASVTAGSTAGLTFSYYTDAAGSIAYNTPVTATAGIYYIKGITSTGCYDIKPVTVVSNPTPAVVITNPATVCFPATMDLTALSVTAGSTTGLTFTYFTDPACTIVYNSPAVAGASTYYIKGSTGARCYDIKPVSVTVNPKPTVIITNPAAVCSPATADLTAASITVGSTIGLTYSYYTNAACTVVYSTPATAGAGTYYIKGTSVTGCYDIQPVIVTVNPKPVITIVPPASVCSPSTVDLTVASITAGSTSGLTFTYFTNAAGTIVYSTPSTAGAGTYYIKGTSSAGCSDIKPVTVTVNPKPTVVITNPVATCAPSTVNLTAASVTTGSTAGLTYTYFTDAAGTIVYPTPATASAGTYYIRGTSATGCSDIKPVIVTVNPQPSATISGTTGVCQNATSPTITFTGSNGTAPYTFTYKINSGTNQIIVSTGNTATVSAPTTSVGVYTYTLVSVQDASPTGCSKAIGTTAIITVNAPPAVPVATATPSTICSGNSSNLVVSVPGTNTYSWTGAPSATAGLPATAGTPSASNSNISVTPTATTVYTVTSTNSNGCTNTGNATVNVNPTPVVTIVPDYCVVAGKVRLVASSVPTGATFVWSTGQTGATVDVDIASQYSVTATLGSCSSTAGINIARELVVNGDFTSVNTGFTSDYNYKPDGAGNSELVDDSGNNGYSISTNGQNVHSNFWGKDHTNNSTGSRNFMLVNGHGTTLVVWKETINVLPNTTYYFSAWAMSLNSAGNNAQLRFSVNGTLTGTTAVLANHGESAGAADNWTRFYGTWTSGPTTTSADIYINDLQAALGGNDFGLDDISFGTLSTYITLESASGTDAQVMCSNTPLTNIVYAVGNGSPSGPAITGLPSGVTSTFTGDHLTISGTPTVPGSYAYSINTTGTCTPSSASGTITVQMQTLNLTSGSSTPVICINSPVSIGYTFGGTATGASITSGSLPAGVSTSVSGNTFTISGSPSVTGTYPFSVTTSGTCTSLSLSGVINIQSQSITLISGNTGQTVCSNSPISSIQYSISGSGTGASVSGLPAGVTGVYNSGQFIISGTPTLAGTYNYTVTTSGSCSAVTATGSILVTPAAGISLGSGSLSQITCVNTPAATVTFSVQNATNSSATGLPTGVTGTYNAGVYTISGTPTTTGMYNYTITTSGGCGVAMISGTIDVQSQTISLTSGSVSPTLCINSPMTNIVYTIGGSATGVIINGLPAGVSYAKAGNAITISGTPTASGSYPYSITTTGTCTSTSASGTITVQPVAAGGTLVSQNVCSGSSGILTLTAQVGTISRWESSIDGGTTWTNIANTTISNTYTFITITTQYRVLISNSCGSVYSSVGTLSVRNLWTGSMSADWNQPSNWSCGVPTSSTDVLIPNVSPKPEPHINTQTAVCKNLTINPSASLVIDAGQALTVYSNLNNNGIFTIESSGLSSNGSLIVNGTSTGSVTYNRSLAFGSSRNYIISSPVNTSAGGFDGSAIIHNATDYDFGPYVEADNYGWDYQTVLPTSLTPSQGYIAKLPAGNGVVKFTGPLNNTDVSVPVFNTASAGTGLFDNGWNAVGNPFTSAIKITGVDGFIAQNFSDLDPEYSAVYLWNQTGAYTGSEQYYNVICNSGYTGTLNSGVLSENYIQAGQGFLINVKTSGSVVFRKGTTGTGMQVQSGATTMKSSETSWPGLTLQVSNAGRTRYTEVAFNNDMTIGLDKSYDAGLVSASDFNLYTHLVSGDNEADFSIQSLPEQWDNPLVVPVGLDIPQAGKVTFKVTGVILPEGIHPILEDRMNNISTTFMNESDSVTIDLADAVSGIGRFYLHIGGEAIILGNKDLEEASKMIAFYADQRIKIFGTPGEGTKAILYDINGRKMSDEFQLSASYQNEIPVSHISNGIYLLRLVGGTGKHVIKVSVIQ